MILKLATQLQLHHITQFFDAEEDYILENKIIRDHKNVYKTGEVRCEVNSLQIIKYE